MAKQGRVRHTNYQVTVEAVDGETQGAEATLGLRIGLGGTNL
jgi:hypothetical protein